MVTHRKAGVGRSSMPPIVAAGPITSPRLWLKSVARVSLPLILLRLFNWNLEGSASEFNLQVGFRSQRCSGLSPRGV
jgi:hypothetical protein